MSQRHLHRLSPLSLVLALGLPAGLLLGGCSAQLGDFDDPASLLTDEEWWDQGPPADEEVVEEPLAESELGDEGIGEGASVAALGAGSPNFQLPFPCGQVWAGQTRSNHSPLRSVDFNRSNDLGDTVVAAAAGTVTRVGNEGNTSYGRWVEIAHGSGYTTRYAHLSRQDVRYGQRVSAGQRIGTVGSTGGSSGPHLHYELRRYGTAIRPVFDGTSAYFYGTRNYRSRNACGGSSGGSTTTAASGRVNTSGIALNVRSGPGTGYSIVGSKEDGASVRIRCQTRGQRVTGTYGTSTLWDRLASGGYVADVYIYTGSDGMVAPACD